MTDEEAKRRVREAGQQYAQEVLARDLNTRCGVAYVKAQDGSGSYALD